ncbi:MAG: hypothetical protein KGK07_02895 [Chloroflexota bacterium]|nr:hypothetical protein [Chloroflexota bacterium]
MRTLVFVLGLLLLILAAGGSFVVRAQGIGSATLDARCTPKSVPAGVDTLMQCTLTARNTGEAVLANARLSFQPAANLAIPDAYYFFRARRDGVDLAATQNSLDYAFGDLAPGASSTLDIDVIVRSTHRAGADALLVAGPAYVRYASVTISADPDPPATAPLTVSLTRTPPDAEFGPVPSATYELRLTNNGRATIRGAKVDIGYGPAAALSPLGGWTAEGDGHALAIARPLAPGGTALWRLAFMQNGQPCPFVYPAVVITAGDDGGRTMTAAAIGDRGAVLGACTGSGQGGGGDAQALSLPSSGTGGTAGSDGPGMPAPLFALALGLFLAAAGYSVRRLR